MKRKKEENNITNKKQKLSDKASLSFYGNKMEVYKCILEDNSAFFNTLFNGEFYLEMEDESIFINRDIEVFKIIYNRLLKGDYNNINLINVDLYNKELDYYGIELPKLKKCEISCYNNSILFNSNAFNNFQEIKNIYGIISLNDFYNNQSGDYHDKDTGYFSNFEDAEFKDKKKIHETFQYYDNNDLKYYINTIILLGFDFTKKTLQNEKCYYMHKVIEVNENTYKQYVKLISNEKKDHSSIKNEIKKEDNLTDEEKKRLFQTIKDIKI